MHAEEGISTVGAVRQPKENPPEDRGGHSGGDKKKGPFSSRGVVGFRHAAIVSLCSGQLLQMKDRGASCSRVPTRVGRNRIEGPGVAILVKLGLESNSRAYGERREKVRGDGEPSFAPETGHVLGDLP